MLSTASAVMIASPIPMTVWTPTIAVATVLNGTSTVPPTSKRTENANAAVGTETSAATAAAGTTMTGA